jgi:hypothetical protein
MWVAYREGDVEGALPLLHSDCEFVTTDGRVRHGHDEIRKFFHRFDERGARFSAQPYSFERRPGGWIVVGNRRIETADGMSDERLYFTHVIADGLIVQLAAHSTREEAVASLDHT